MMLRFYNTKSSMLFNLMPVGEAPGISLWCLREKKQFLLGSANLYGSAVFDWYLWRHATVKFGKIP